MQEERGVGGYCRQRRGGRRRSERERKVGGFGEAREGVVGAY